VFNYTDYRFWLFGSLPVNSHSDFDGIVPVPWLVYIHDGSHTFVTVHWNWSHMHNAVARCTLVYWLHSVDCSLLVRWLSYHCMVGLVHTAMLRFSCPSICLSHSPGGCMLCMYVHVELPSVERLSVYITKCCWSL